MKPTIFDVAARAGASISSVSRALSGKGYVSASLREKVDRAVAELGYIPHGSAQSLRRGTARTIGLVVGDADCATAAQLIGVVQAAVARRGYSLLIGTIRESAGETDRAALEAMLRQRPDGLIVATLAGAESDAFIAKIASPAMPVVLIGRHIDHPSIDAVAADNHQGGRLLAEHLIGLGHREIGFVGAKLRDIERIGRLRGCIDTLRRHGLAVRSDWVVGEDDAFDRPCYPNYDAGYRAAQRLLRNDAIPSALLARNDATAVGAMRAFEDSGVAVPDCICVAGFGNSLLGAAVSPALTTVCASTNATGALAAEWVVSRIEGCGCAPPPPRFVSQSCDLIVRKSTAAACRCDRTAAQRVA